MIWTRGNKKDYNDWYAAGNPGWSWNEVLPYYKRMERANLKEYQHNGWHGFDGPVSVEDCPFRYLVALKLIFRSSSKHLLSKV
jgi:choline dehydrogenase-like flavoprotein